MRTMKWFCKLSIILAFLVDATSFVYAYGAGFNIVNNHSNKKQINAQEKLISLHEKMQSGQSQNFVVLVGEIDKPVSDNSSLSLAANTISTCIHRNATIGALAGRGYDDLYVDIVIQLDLDGKIKGQPELRAHGGNEEARELFVKQTLEAIYSCEETFQKLPNDKYEIWHRIRLRIKLGNDNHGNNYNNT